MPFRGFGDVAEEFGGPELFSDLEPDFLRRRVAGPGPGLAGFVALAFHSGVEAVRIDAHAPAPERVFRQVEGETVGIVELERRLAVQRAVFLEIRRRFVEEPEPPVQGLLEAGFLQFQGIGDQRLGAGEVGIGAAHLFDQRRHQFPHQRFLRAHLVRVTHGPAHDPPQHVAAAFVGRQHAVGNQETAGPEMVGDDPVRDVVFALRLRPRSLGGSPDQGLEQVDVVIVVGALHDGGGAFQSHAGVDGRLRQVDPLVLGHLFELHEHQVPDFDEAVAVLVGAARRAAGDMFAVVIEDFRTRAAGAGVAHGPEVVRRRDAEDLLLR